MEMKKLKQKLENRNQKSETSSGTPITSFEDLIVWQKAHQLMLNVYRFLKLLPKEKDFNRKLQLRRSVSSVPANIAEGYGRFHYQENVQFCRQARGSLIETKNHILAARDLQQAPENICQQIIQQCDEVAMILNGYIRSTRNLKYNEARKKQVVH